MTTTALLAQVKARLYATAGDHGECVDLRLQAYDDLAKLLAIVEVMRAALEDYAKVEDSGRKTHYWAAHTLLAADKLAGGE